MTITEQIERTAGAVEAPADPVTELWQEITKVRKAIDRASHVAGAMCRPEDKAQRDQVDHQADARCEALGKLQERIAGMEPSSAAGCACQAALLADWIEIGAREDKLDLALARRIAAWLQGAAEANAQPVAHLRREAGPAGDDMALDQARKVAKAEQDYWRTWESDEAAYEEACNRLNYNRAHLMIQPATTLAGVSARLRQAAYLLESALDYSSDGVVGVRTSIRDLERLQLIELAERDRAA